MTRLLLRAAGLLSVVCAVLIVGVITIGKVLPGVGQLIYFSRYSQPGVIQLGGERGSLQALDLATGISTPIVSQGVTGSFALSPDSRQITLYWGGGIPQVYVVNVDGSNLRRMDNTDLVIVGWMPDSTQVLTSDLIRGTVQRINVNDFSRETLTQFESLCAFVLSPDGQYMAYQTVQSFSPPMNARLCAGISISRLDGDELHTYLSNVQQIFAVWSPDSQQIALLNNFALYILPDVTQDTLLEVRDVRMFVPISTLAWSQDSTRVAFSADITFDIYVVPVRPQLGQAVNLTPNTPSQEFNPVWLPSGHELVFTSTRDSLNGEIYIMRDDGTNVRRLTVNRNREQGLVWLP